MQLLVALFQRRRMNFGNLWNVFSELHVDFWPPLLDTHSKPYLLLHTTRLFDHISRKYASLGLGQLAKIRSSPCFAA